MDWLIGMYSTPEDIFFAGFALGILTTAAIGWILFLTVFISDEYYERKENERVKQ